MNCQTNVINFNIKNLYYGKINYQYYNKRDHIIVSFFFLNKIAFYYRMIFLYKEAIQRQLFDINDLSI